PALGRRLIALPSPGNGIVARQTRRSEVVGLTLGNVRFGSKADMGAAPTDVRFTPKSGHWPTQFLFDHTRVCIFRARVIANWRSLAVAGYSLFRRHRSQAPPPGNVNSESSY